MATMCPDANVRLLVKPDLTAETDNIPEVVIGPTCSDLGDGVTELPPAVDECVTDSDVADNLILPPAPGFADNDDETIVKCASVHTSASTSGDCDGDFAHVQPVINKLPESLTAEQREKVIELIKRNADIFGRHEFDVGCTKLVTASIITDPGHPPIAEPLRRHARVHLDVIDKTIERMKHAGIVEDACSLWNANLVVVGRKDDQGRPTTPRVTIDFRG